MMTLLPTHISPSLEWEGQDSIGRDCRFSIRYDANGDIETEATYQDGENRTWFAYGDDYRYIVEGFLSAHFAKPQGVN